MNTFRTPLVLLSILSLFALAQPVMAEEKPEADLSEIMEELTPALELTDEQVPQVEAALVGYLQSLDAAQAKYEDVEEPDAQAMLGDFKKCQSDYYQNLQKVLSKEQWEKYQTLKNQILDELFSEIAYLRIIDLREPLSLSEDQMEAMKPVMGTSLKGVFETIIKYGDQKMNKRTKLKIASSLKSIKSEQDSQMKKILSDEQLAAWQALKDEQQS